MRKGLFVGSAFVVLLAGGGLVAYALAPVRNSILGRVVDETERPARGATVELRAMDESVPPRSTKTDAVGWFSFNGLPDIRFSLRVEIVSGVVVSLSELRRGAIVTVQATANAARPASSVDGEAHR